ncbi:MAG: class I SAM-dependent methyltransferase [Anaerolineaceae bacterium]|nr:class I SAM-dependent methyltransferase [Anaerolineaceae bacterium]
MNEQKNIIETFSEMASRYESLMNSELNRFWGVSYLGFVQELIGEIDFGSHQHILDIATGTAFIPQYLSAQKISYDQVIGLDITFEMLFNAKKQMKENGDNSSIQLVCASAHAMPFKKNIFDITTCCLATHHMDVNILLDNIYSSLKPDEKFHVADVGGSKRWKIGIIRAFIKLVAFIYFLFTENLARAKAESGAIANIHTMDAWRELIADHGFVSIKIRELKSKRFWVPNPVIIEAKKPMEVRK